LSLPYPINDCHFTNGKEIYSHYLRILHIITETDERTHADYITTDISYMQIIISISFSTQVGTDKLIKN